MNNARSNFNKKSGRNNNSKINDKAKKKQNSLVTKNVGESFLFGNDLDLFNNSSKRESVSEEELDIIKRGRNYKRSSHPKHTDVVTYKYSTGFEALIGYLYLSNNKERLTEILNQIEVK